MAVQAQIYGMPFGDTSNNDFCFNLQQPQESLQHPQQRKQFLPSDNNTPTTTTTTNNNNFVFSEIVTTQFQIDKYMNLQNERLRSALREQSTQHLASLISKIEARAAMAIRQREEEIARGLKRSTELREYMKRMEMENQAWRRIAGENEALIANLNANIEQLMTERASSARLQQQNPSNREVEDAESCCDVDNFEEEGKAGENRGVVAEGTGERNSKRRRKEEMMMAVCRRCNSGDSSVLLLPCRHLCCCKACEAFLYACPVCRSVKQGCIEVLVS